MKKFLLKLIRKHSDIDTSEKLYIKEEKIFSIFPQTGKTPIATPQELVTFVNKLFNDNIFSPKDVFVISIFKRDHNTFSGYGFAVEYREKYIFCKIGGDTVYLSCYQENVVIHKSKIFRRHTDENNIIELCTIKNGKINIEEKIYEDQTARGEPFDHIIS